MIEEGKSYKLKKIRNFNGNIDTECKVIKIKDDLCYIYNPDEDEYYIINKNNIIDPEHPEDEYSDIEIIYPEEKNEAWKDEYFGLLEKPWSDAVDYDKKVEAPVERNEEPMQDSPEKIFSQGTYEDKKDEFEKAIEVLRFGQNEGDKKEFNNYLDMFKRTDSFNQFVHYAKSVGINPEDLDAEKVGLVEATAVDDAVEKRHQFAKAMDKYYKAVEQFEKGEITFEEYDAILNEYKDAYNKFYFDVDKEHYIECLNSVKALTEALQDELKVGDKVKIKDDADGFKTGEIQHKIPGGYSAVNTDKRDAEDVKNGNEIFDNDDLTKIRESEDYMMHVDAPTAGRFITGADIYRETGLEPGLYTVKFTAKNKEGIEMPIYVAQGIIDEEFGWNTFPQIPDHVYNLRDREIGEYIFDAWRAYIKEFRFDEMTNALMKAVEGAKDLVETLNSLTEDKNEFKDKIQKIIKDEDLPGYAVIEKDGMVGVEVDGDWKHEHAYFTNQMGKHGLWPEEHETIGDGDSDCYTAIYYFKESLNKADDKFNSSKAINEGILYGMPKSTRDEIIKVVNDAIVSGKIRDRLDTPDMYCDLISEKVGLDLAPDEWVAFAKNNGERLLMPRQPKDESVEDIVTVVDIPLVTEKLYNKLVNLLYGNKKDKNRDYEQQGNVLNFLQEIEDRIPLGCEFHTDLEEYGFTEDEINAIKKIVRDERVYESVNEEDKFRYDGKIKIKQITKDEWNKTHKDYKSIKDGKKYIMYIDPESHKTVLGRCEIIDESLNEAKVDAETLKIDYKEIRDTKLGREIEARDKHVDKYVYATKDEGKMYIGTKPYGKLISINIKNGKPEGRFDKETEEMIYNKLK